MILAYPRKLWAWFLWTYLERFPTVRNWILFAQGKAFPIFLDYPVVPLPRYGYGRPVHPQLNALLARERARYETELDAIAALAPSLARIPFTAEGAAPGEPVWNNAMLPPVDAASIYALLVNGKPARYFEIGSGNSTRFARRAIRDFNLPTRITSIDPCPRAEVESLVDRSIRQPLEEIDLAIFRELSKGDVLYVDNSHRTLMNSDVTVFFLEILPILPSGVIVGLHDINLPWDYPSEIAVRYYSEQYMLAVHLLAEGSKTQVLLPCFYASRDPALSKRLEPLWTALEGKCTLLEGSAFWLVVSDWIVHK